MTHTEPWITVYHGATEDVHGQSTGCRYSAPLRYRERPLGNTEGANSFLFPLTMPVKM